MRIIQLTKLSQIIHFAGNPNKIYFSAGFGSSWTTLINHQAIQKIAEDLIPAGLKIRMIIASEHISKFTFSDLEIDQAQDLNDLFIIEL